MSSDIFTPRGLAYRRHQRLRWITRRKPWTNVPWMRTWMMFSTGQNRWDYIPGKQDKNHLTFSTWNREDMIGMKIQNFREAIGHEIECKDWGERIPTQVQRALKGKGSTWN